MVKKKLDQIVYEHVVKLIESGQLLEREHITEQMVADSLEISRTPVRKAFQRLVCDNFLENIENAGVRVKSQELGSKGFLDRVNFIERLINYYLFDVEKNEKIIKTDELIEHLNEMEQTTNKSDYDFEFSEIDYWHDLLKNEENLYTKENILKPIHDILFDEGSIYAIQKNSRSTKLTHLKELTNYLEEMNYAKARREVRILFNKLKLNVLESGQKFK